ncbi:uncharacterized protein E0L32_006719 [Thyridium curvatum]|uniref:Amino acid transporter transmembrane domain-containing protein n=1 Tax=Thyridium curvatum TaxID=1093900 RepID=A0A507B649_9PEZI|nr:uncharacterized protein E0L32_006719 [Thyridium curvatum]TPX12839.1 hypothetical protein E0L32_006719 [Thyridium curvatum]
MNGSDQIQPTHSREDHIIPVKQVKSKSNSTSKDMAPQDPEARTSSDVDGMFSGEVVGEIREREYQEDIEKRLTKQGDAHFHRLGWKRLTVVLIVEAIALGSLSIPSAFATLGMVAGVIVTVGLGLVAIYTSYVVGQVKLRFPHVSHYADAGRLIWGRFGYELVGIMFSLQLTFLVGSHCLTGTIAFLNLSNNGACSLAFGVVSAVILLLLAIPPSFAEVAILGYIDFVSIILAIGITIIATGVESNEAPGGLAAVAWSAWPKDGLTFAEAFIAITNIVFAYSFAVCQFSFMDEMHTPQDFPKSIWALGLIEIFIYTLTGALIYVFVGQDVKAPALLSAGPLMSKIAFGIGLPVIFISGSINTTVVARYIHGRVFKGSVIRYINTPMGWATWLGLCTAVTIVAWIIAEAIPFFSDLLSISSSLFISGFTFYFPALFWFLLIKEGKWYERKNLLLSVVNGIVFLIGMVVLVGGTYASIKDIVSFELSPKGF